MSLSTLFEVLVAILGVVSIALEAGCLRLLASF